MVYWCITLLVGVVLGADVELSVDVDGVVLSRVVVNEAMVDVEDVAGSEVVVVKKVELGVVVEGATTLLLAVVDAAAEESAEESDAAPPG